MIVTSSHAFSARTTYEVAFQALRAARSHLATFFRLRCRLVVSSNACRLTGNAATLLKNQDLANLHDKTEKSFTPFTIVVSQQPFLLPVRAKSFRAWELVSDC